MYNRLMNMNNPYQGSYRRVLCVCSGGMLRSATAAMVLSQEPYNYNTRAVGIDDTVAVCAIEDNQLFWAQEIVCMNAEHEAFIKEKLALYNLSTPVFTLSIPDNYRYRDPALVELIKTRYAQTALEIETAEERG